MAPDDPLGTARTARATRSLDRLPMAALVGEVDAAPVRAAGWSVAGRVGASPFGQAPLADVPGYVDLAELLIDSRLDLAVVDGTDEGFARHLPALRDAGLLVLLPTPAPLDERVLLPAHAVDGPPVAVGLLSRWQPWARAVHHAVPLAGPIVQVTVRGWPRGASAGAELVDLVRQWSDDDVVAVAAAPGPLPAERLPDGERVAWSLLLGSGATVLVSHDGAGPRVRISTQTARLEAAPDLVRWSGGEQIALPPLPAGIPPGPAGIAPELVAIAAELLPARGGGDVLPLTRIVEAGRRPEQPADLADLLAAARALTALRASARTERLCTVS